MKLPLLLCSIPTFNFILLATVLASPSPCEFPAVFNLGDSNSDTGGLSASLKPVRPPFGQTYFGMTAGRFTDGRLIIDFIAESFGLPFLSAYLDSLGANFSHGADFATAGSPIIAQNVTLAQGGLSPVSLDLQLVQLSLFKSRSILIYEKGGVFKDLVPKEEYFSQALYTIDIGQNDLTFGYFLKKSMDELIPAAIEQLSAVVKGIYEMGGRYFWIHNTGPLGCLPGVLKGNLYPTELDQASCGNPANKLAQHFNIMLKETVAQLRTDLPLAALTYVDVYSAKYKLISHAKELGFEHPLMACCGYGGGDYNFDFGVECGDTIEVNGTKVFVGSCENPSKRINWDGFHYTEAANKWVFDQISKGDFSEPQNSLSTACRRQEAANKWASDEL